MSCTASRAAKRRILHDPVDQSIPGSCLGSEVQAGKAALMGGAKPWSPEAGNLPEKLQKFTNIAPKLHKKYTKVTKN